MEIYRLLFPRCALAPLLLSLVLLVSLSSHIDGAPYSSQDSRSSSARKCSGENHRLERELDRIKDDYNRHLRDLQRRFKEQIHRLRERQQYERLRKQHEQKRLKIEKERENREKIREKREMQRARRESSSQRYQPKPSQSPDSQLQPTSEKECYSPHCVAQLVLSAMNTSADPCEDFYQYSCGSWIANTTVPPERGAISRSFTTAGEEVEVKVRALLEIDLQKPGHPNAIAGRLFASCMEGFGTGALNVRPLRPFISVLNRISDSSSLALALAKVHAAGQGGLFAIEAFSDLKDPTKNALYIAQGQISLPDRDLYNRTDAIGLQVKNAYVRFGEALLQVAATAGLIQSANFTDLAEDVFQFEKQLAAVTLSPAEQRDLDKLYNKAKLSNLPPSLFFDTYLKASNVSTTDLNGTVINTNPNYLLTVGEMMKRVETNLAFRRTVKAYLAARITGGYASSGILGEDIFKAANEWSNLQTGVTKEPERWKMCVGLTNGYLGDAVGEAYVRKYFPEARKEVAERLLLQIGAQFRANLGRQDWMDVETQRLAKEKLDFMTWKIAYPSSFDKYAGLTIRKSSFAENIQTSLRYYRRRNLDKLGKPVDRTKWTRPAHEVNAIYDFLRNEMRYPAGILQSPFFSDHFPDAMNFGSIGAVVGHEISHGFDDQGRKFDKYGRLVDWWSTQSGQRFNERAQCYIDLYDGYRPDGLNTSVNGALTIGENLADAGGVKTAFQAFASSANNKDETARAPNAMLSPLLTNHQLFFVSYAQTWCGKQRPETLKLALLKDPHSPTEFRVKGPLSQSEDFAHVFKCKPGSAYNPPKKCVMW